jgi:ribonuclease Z
VIDVRDERRSILFDLGHRLSNLPPRVLLRTTHAFVTHTHMDHFAGFDHLLAVALGRVRRIALFGGPGFVSQVEHKLRAYTWNVVHRYEVPLVLDVSEVSPGGLRRRARFSSRDAFERTDDRAWPCVEGDDVLHDEATFRVRARFVDHEMPVLALVLEEKARVRVDAARLAAMGYTRGAWLGSLKRAVMAGASPAEPIEVRWRDRDGDHAVSRTVGELSAVVLDVIDGRRIGYVTDLRNTEANVTELRALLNGVDVLHIESVFLAEDVDHAVRKNHLTARQAGTIARLVGARSIVPFHFSPRYEGRQQALVAEAVAAWKGG